MTPDEKINLIGNFEEMFDRLIENEKEVTYVSKGGNSIKGYWVGKIIRIDINLKGEEI